MLRRAKTNYQDVPSGISIYNCFSKRAFQFSTSLPNICILSCFEHNKNLTISTFSRTSHLKCRSLDRTHIFTRPSTTLYEILKKETTWENRPARAVCTIQVRSQSGSRHERDAGGRRCRTLRERRWLPATRYMAAYEPRSRDAEAVEEEEEE
jgi:hypothetical protein